MAYLSAHHPVVGRDLDAVLLDVGGVITVPDPIALALVLEPYGATTAVSPYVRAHYVGMYAHATSAHEGRSAWVDYIRAYVAEVGVPDARAEDGFGAFTRVFGHYAWRFPLVETITAMERLREAEVPLGIVSNASGQVEPLLAGLGLAQVGPGGGIPVEVVVDSGVLGVEKPDPACFAPALQVMAGLGLDPGRIGYVGDSVRYDVAGARAAGLVPLLLDPHDLHAEVDLGPGAHRIESLHDLLAPPPPVNPASEEPTLG